MNKFNIKSNKDTRLRYGAIITEIDKSNDNNVIIQCIMATFYDNIIDNIMSKR